MPATSELYGETDWRFTFDKSIKTPSSSRKYEESTKSEPCAFGQHDQINDDDMPFVCSRNECFTGMVIGLPLSLLAWVGIFSILYLLFH